MYFVKPISCCIYSIFARIGYRLPKQKQQRQPSSAFGNYGSSRWRINCDSPHYFSRKKKERSTGKHRVATKSKVQLISFPLLYLRGINNPSSFRNRDRSGEALFLHFSPLNEEKKHRSGHLKKTAEIDSSNSSSCTAINTDDAQVKIPPSVLWFHLYISFRHNFCRKFRVKIKD